jgi:hypothetical protein
MKNLLLLSILATSILIVGCVAPPTSELRSSNGSGMEGSVVTYEDGMLELRLTNGSSMLFRTPEYDPEITKSKGRSCRVQFKRVWSDDIAAYGWFNEVTKLEWLEPYDSSRFTSVWE